MRMKSLLVSCFALLAAAAAAQERVPRAVLRFDEAKSEELADLRVADDAAEQADARPFAYKLNRRRTSEAATYDAVTLWNVRRVRVKSRQMRLSDTTRRERVRLLKFFTERNRRKGARPHLLGNVVGYTWVSHIRKGGRWREVPAHIGLYTLRAEVDSLRRVGVADARGAVPEAFRHALPRTVPYWLNGVQVPSPVFQFIDGLILRRLDVVDDPETGLRVEGDTYPGRVPLVVMGGERTTVAAWLEMCRAGWFEMSAEVPMHYYYIQPVEAVQLYGEAGRYGAIRIDVAE